MENPTTYTIDLTAIIGKLIWPIITLVILFSKRFKDLTESLLSRITKVEFAGVTLELPVAKSYLPDEGKPAGTIEYWHKASSSEISDSYSFTFTAQLREEGSSDYAIIDIGTGQSWLTSRLFIISILYPQIKGIKAFVFVETINGVRKKYLGWVSTNQIRTVLARTFPKLQKEFKEALINVLKNDANIVIGGDGELLDSYGSKAIEANVKLLGDFLQRIQSSNLSSAEAPNEYTLLKTSPDQLYEQGRWINGEYLEKITGRDLNIGALRSSELRTKPEKEQINLVAAMSGQFVAVTNDEHRFEYLIDRQLLLERYTIQALTATESISDPKKKSHEHQQ